METCAAGSVDESGIGLTTCESAAGMLDEARLEADMAGFWARRRQQREKEATARREHAASREFGAKETDAYVRLPTIPRRMALLVC